jgi:hypothetical protein
MGKSCSESTVGRGKGTVASRATGSTGKGSQGTALCDGHRSEDVRLSPTTGDPNGRSNPTSPTTHHGSGAPHCARDPPRNKISKRGHCLKCSWPIKNLCLGMQEAKCYKRPDL